MQNRNRLVAESRHSVGGHICLATRNPNDYLNVELVSVKRNYTSISTINPEDARWLRDQLCEIYGPPGTKTSVQPPTPYHWLGAQAEAA